MRTRTARSGSSSTARSSTTSSCARSSRRWATGSGRRATPRSSSTPTRQWGDGRLRALQRAVRDRAVGRGDRDARPGPRSAGRPPALPVRARRPPLVRQRGEGHLRGRPHDPARARPGRPRRDLHLLDDGRRPRPCSQGVTELEPGHVRTVSRRAHRRPGVLGAPLPGRRPRTVSRDRSRRPPSRCARRSRSRSACGCCGPTCRWAATSPAGSTARSWRRSGRRAKGEQFCTFSIRFEDAEYDETPFQRLDGGPHRERSPGDHRFGAATSPTSFPTSSTTPSGRCCGRRRRPLFLLSRLVRESGIKVVLTGEGADEMFAGYDLFREAKVRRFWGRQPASTIAAAAARPALPVPGAARRSPSGRWRGSSSAGVASGGPRQGSRHQTRWQPSGGAAAPLHAGRARGGEPGRRRRAAARLAARRLPALVRSSPRTSTSRSGPCSPGTSSPRRATGC